MSARDTDRQDKDSDGRQHSRRVGKYDYTDEAGALLYQVLRYEPKTFKQRRPSEDGNGWFWNLREIRRVLYRLPEVEWAAVSGDTIYVAEGEKDVDALVEVGVTATCNPGGAGKWRDEYADFFRGSPRVVVIADADAPGRNHADRVAKSIRRVTTVEVVESAEGKDAYDHLAAGWTVEDFVRVDAREEGVPGSIPTFDELLSRATTRSHDTGRNEACLWLACQLRDHRYDEVTAWATVARYQASVGGNGDHAFSLAEARVVFDRNFFGEPRPPWGAVASDSFALTDYGNAERLVARHGEDLRYVHAWKSWLVWDGRRFQRDASDEVGRRAKETSRFLYKQASEAVDDQERKALVAFARKSEAAPRLEATVKLAQSEPGIPVEPSRLDADGWFLNVANGRVNLRTGVLHEHDRNAYETKLAPVAYDPKARAPSWESFLETVMPDANDQAFLQRAVGYSLTGDVSERVLFVMHGSGANGKTVFLEALRAVLGDYAQQASSELILAKRPGSIPADVARLQGARFVTASETEGGSRLGEALVKNLTGGDRIVARRLYSDWSEFDPTHKLWLATNHKPIVYGTDHAIWERLRLIPFTVAIPPNKRIKNYFGTRLAAELPGILAWAVEGCLAWQREGLNESINVRDATEEYRSDSDLFGSFIEDSCITGVGKEVSAQALFAEYEVWTAAQNLKPMNNHAFSRKLRERGFLKERRGKANTTYWQGIAVPHRTPDGKLRVVGGDGE